MMAEVDLEYERVRDFIQLIGSLLEDYEGVWKRLRLIEETLEVGNRKLARAFLKKLEVEVLTQYTSYFKGRGRTYRLSERFRPHLDELERHILEGRPDEAFRSLVRFRIEPSDIVTEGVGEEEELAFLETESQDALDYVEKVFEYMQKKEVKGEEGRELSEMFIQMKKKLRDGDYAAVKEIGDGLVERLLHPREQFRFTLELKLERLEHILRELEESREVLGVEEEKMRRWRGDFLEVKRAVSEGLLLKSDLKIKELSEAIEPYRERLMEEIVKRVLSEAEELLSRVEKDTSFERFIIMLARKRLQEGEHRDAYQFAVKARILLRRKEVGVDESLRKKVRKYEELVGALILPGEMKRELQVKLQEIRGLMERGEGRKADESLKELERVLLEMAEG